MKRLVIFIVASFCSLLSFAQTGEDNRLLEAKDAFEDYNFIEASDLLEDYLEETIHQNKKDKLIEVSLLLADCYLYLGLYNKALGYLNYVLLIDGYGTIKGTKRDQLKRKIRSDQCLFETKKYWEMESKAQFLDVTFAEAEVEGDIELEFIFRKLQAKYQIVVWHNSPDRIAVGGQMLLDLLHDERYEDVNVMEKCDALLGIAQALFFLKRYDEGLYYTNSCYWLLDDNDLLTTPIDFKCQFYKTLALFYGNDNAMLDAHWLNIIAKTYLKKQLPRMGESDRKDLWSYYQHWFVNVLPRMGFNSKQNGIGNLSWASNIYDGLLISRGMLLNSDLALRKFIYQSGDDHLSRLMDSINFCKDKIAQNYLARSYADQKSKLERRLMKEAINKGYRMEVVDVSFEDIRKKLHYDEVAIEFQRFITHENDTLYMALIITPDYDIPTITEIGNEKTMRDAEKDLNKLREIWNVLEIDLTGVNKLYFAADGILHRLPIEHFKDGTLIEDCELYRLSSTRELVLHENKNFGNEAVIYGGFDYFLDETGKVAPSSTSPRDSEAIRALRGVVDMTPALPGTKVEAEQIAVTINGNQNSSFKAELIMGKEGTEASFKALSHKNKSIIHIGTHGFYIPKNNETNYSELEAMNIRPNYLYSEEEDIVMERSGLLFSGCDNTLFGDEGAIDDEDGIMTAREISLLDLSGCDLVTLSACHTAKGDIAADGVFGLQRGLKQAGVNSLLMSLWAVDDKATQILMTEFYSNLVNGLPKHESLKLAQQKVKNTKGYEDPKYWAAFILLDALD